MVSESFLTWCSDMSGPAWTPVDLGTVSHKHFGPFLIRPEVCKHLHASRLGILSDAIALRECGYICDTRS